MFQTTVLIALAALLAMSLSLKAEGSKPEESQAEQPYTDQLGDNQVTSVKREITKGGVLVASVERSCYRQPERLSR
jgi:hypothetical protein